MKIISCIAFITTILDIIITFKNMVLGEEVSVRIANLVSMILYICVLVGLLN